MSGKRYLEEFKVSAMQQVVDRGYPVSSVASRLGISTKSLYEWIKRFGDPKSGHNQLTNQEREILSPSPRL